MTGLLRLTLEQACAEAGVSLNALTVLAVQNDPFRIDTPAKHRDGAWFAEQLERLGLGRARIHLRGLHYRVLTVEKPDGSSYENTESDWVWLQDKAADAARWLGYVDFEAIEDRRNAEPVVRPYQREDPYPYLQAGINIEIPDPDDIEPVVGIRGFEGRQPYRLVLFGEKSSLEPVLGPIADEFEADLFLMTGEISDTRLFEMAKVGADDGRPMVVFTVSDCDPAGWQMPISIGRKLQALKALKFSALEFQVRRVGLLPEQVRDLGLPSTPLKGTEKRADDWTAAMGLEQTEVDALLAFQPELLNRLVRQAMQPFFDDGLVARVREAEEEWLDEAQAALDATIDPDVLAQIRDEAAEKLSQLEDEIEALNNAIRVQPYGLRLPPIVIPEPELDGSSEQVTPLVDSRWAWAEQTLSLKRSKGYR